MYFLQPIIPSLTTARTHKQQHMQSDWLHFVAQFLQTQTRVLQTRSTICSTKQVLGLLHHLMYSSCSSDCPSALNSQSCSPKKCAPCTHENFLFSNKCTICNNKKNYPPKNHSTITTKKPLDYKGENRTTSEIPKEREANIFSWVFQTT